MSTEWILAIGLMVFAWGIVGSLAAVIREEHFVFALVAGALIAIGARMIAVALT